MSRSLPALRRWLGSGIVDRLFRVESIRTLSAFVVMAAVTVSCAVPMNPVVPVAPLPISVSVPRAPQHEEHAEGHQAGHAEHHGAGTQTANFFVGGSDEAGEFGGATFGLDYEYRLAPKWGVGGFAEVVTGIDRSFATGLQAYWHVYGELVLVGGVGAERHHDEWAAIGRVGAQ